MKKKSLVLLVIVGILLIGTLTVNAYSNNIQNFTYNYNTDQANGNIGYNLTGESGYYNRSCYYEISYNADYYNVGGQTFNYGNRNAWLSGDGTFYCMSNSLGITSQVSKLYTYNIPYDSVCLWSETQGYSTKASGDYHVYLFGARIKSSLINDFDHVTYKILP